MKLKNTGDSTWIFYKENYPKEWKTYKKFSIVRDPLTRFISSCKYCIMEESKKDFNTPFWELDGCKRPENTYKVDYDIVGNSTKMRLPQDHIKTILKERTINDFIDLLYSDKYEVPFRPWWPQTFHICDKNNKIMVDEIIRFENLQSNSIGIDFKKYKKINQSLIDVQNIKLNKKSVEKIFEIYRTDFETFNYKNPTSFLKYF